MTISSVTDAAPVHQSQTAHTQKLQPATQQQPQDSVQLSHAALKGSDTDHDGHCH